MANFSLTSKWADGHDGTRLFVEHSVNTEKDLDILLCDGIGCDGFIWTHLWSDLSAIGNVIHPHMRGHGKSHAPENYENLKISDFALDLETVRRTLSTETRPVIVLGHSMGVQVALEYIHQNPHRCVLAIFICGGFEHPATTFHYEDNLAKAIPVLKALAKIPKKPLAKIWRTALRLPVAFTVARLTETHPDRTERHIFEPYLRHLADMDLDVFLQTLDFANQHSARSYLDELRQPTLVLAGEDDRMTPPKLAGELAKLLPNSVYYGITEGTHIAPVEFPNETNQVIMRFLRKHL